MSLEATIKTIEGDVKDVALKVEEYFEKGLQFAEKYVLPVAAVAVADIPGLPAPVAAAVAGLSAFMKGAQAVLPASGQGPLRLQAVQGAVQGVCQAVGYDYGKIQKTVVAAVNTSIGLVNTFKPDPAPESAASTASSAADPSLGNASGAE